MNKSIIKKYVDKLSKKDIYDYTKKEGIVITDNEIDLIYKILKNDIDKLLNHDFISYISNYKSFFSEQVYDFMIEKYNKYKMFID